jgi:Zn-finger nucleic acid-binding protein
LNRGVTSHGVTSSATTTGNYGKGYDRDYDRRRHKKKEGWLGDLFDF